MPPNALQFLMLTAAGWLNRHQQGALAFLQAEHSHCANGAGSDRSAKAAFPTSLGEAESAVLREQLASFGHKPRFTDKQSLIVSIATKCRSWGYTRIRGVLQSLGITVSRSTIARILREAGKSVDWLRGPSQARAPVVEMQGRRREHARRHVTDERRRSWAAAAGLATGVGADRRSPNLTDGFDGFLRDARYLIMDRDPIFTNHFRQILKWRGVEAVRLPARSPNLNSFAERFVLSIKSECLSKIIPLGERHLRWAIREYAAHYHEERPHQGIGNVIIDPPAQAVNPYCAKRRIQRMRESAILSGLSEGENDDSEIVCSERLGGVLKHFRQSAA